MANRKEISEAKALTGISSTSDVVAMALEQLIRAERLRSDIVAYTQHPPSEDEVALAATTPAWDDLEDDTDWEATYQDE